MRKVICVVKKVRENRLQEFLVNIDGSNFWVISRRHVTVGDSVTLIVRVRYVFGVRVLLHHKLSHL